MTGAFELQSLDFSNRDMLLALTVSGKTPCVGRCATPVAGRPDSGHHPAADQRGGAAGGYHYCSADRAGGGGGLANPKAQLAQRQIVNMLTTGLAIRDGRVYSNLRVDAG